MKVPESITHAQYREACKPLLDLLGLTDKELFANGLHYDSGVAGTDTVGRLSLTFAVRKVGDDRERPVTKSADGFEPQPCATAELAWVCTVEVKK